MARVHSNSIVIIQTVLVIPYHRLMNNYSSMNIEELIYRVHHHGNQNFASQ